MTKNELLTLIDVFLANNNKLICFYGYIQGVQLGSDPIDNFIEFREALTKDPSEIEEALIPGAVDYLLNDFFTALQSDDFEAELILNLVKSGCDPNIARNQVSYSLNEDFYKIINTLVSEFNRESYFVIFTKLDINIYDYLLGSCFKKRSEDQDTIIQYVLDKKSYLRPLVQRAYAKGRNKYGDQSLDFVLDEAMEFNEYIYETAKYHFYNPYLLASDFVFGAIVSIVGHEEDGSQESEEIPQNGLDFEYWCAQRISDLGWHTIVTPASGDQGVDVLATSGNQQIAIQCKRYSNPVDNSAVQQVYAGMSYYNANKACVISTSGFTKSAQDLAKSLGIELIDANYISIFQEVFEQDALSELEESSLLDIQNDIVKIEFKTESEKAVSKSFLNALPMLQKKDAKEIISYVSMQISDDGLGFIELRKVDFAMFLKVADAYLCAFKELTNEVRTELMSSVNPYIHEVAKNYSRGQVFGIELFADVTPYEIFETFNDFLTLVSYEKSLLEMDFQLEDIFSNNIA